MSDVSKNDMYTTFEDHFLCFSHILSQLVIYFRSYLSHLGYIDVYIFYTKWQLQGSNPEPLGSEARPHSTRLLVRTTNMIVNIIWVYSTTTSNVHAFLVFMLGCIRLVVKSLSFTLMISFT